MSRYRRGGFNALCGVLVALAMHGCATKAVDEPRADMQGAQDWLTGTQVELCDVSPKDDFLGDRGCVAQEEKGAQMLGVNKDATVKKDWLKD